MTFIRKHRWTFITVCLLAILWTVLDVAGDIVRQYENSLWEQLPTLRDHAEAVKIEEKVESLRSIAAFFTSSSDYLIYFFMVLPLLSLILKLDWWLTLAHYLLAHLCKYIFSCLIMGGGLEVVTAPLKWSAYMVLRGYLIWAVFAIVLYLRGEQSKKNDPA